MNAADLENVEGLKLDVLAVLLQHVHHQLQVVGLPDVARHYRKVAPVQQ